MKPVIAVLGVGAIGGYFGGRLAQHGQDVTLIDPWPEHIEKMRASGLRIEGMTPEEESIVKVKTMHLTELQSFSKRNPIDIAIVATKSYDTQWATTMLRPYLAPGGFVMSLQNCINEETIASVIGWGNTIGCVVMMSAELIGPGHVLRTGGKQKAPQVEFRFGETHGRITPRVKQLAEMAQQFDGAEPTTNLWGERWSKLCINAIHNGISAATGLNGNERDNLPEKRRFGIRIGGEVVRTGQALGYEFSHIGSIDAERMALAAEGDPHAFKEADEWMQGGPSGNNRSNAQRPSMAQDIAKGRRTEIEYINGFIAEKAASVGLSAPANLALVELVKAVERGDKKPDPEHIAEIERKFVTIKKAS
jgi:2-dehydropantoate 2-reductase